MTNAEIPLLKAELMKQFGYISYQLVLANLDVIGIRIQANFEIVIIIYRAGLKVGYLYEGEVLSKERVFKIFEDVPENKNDLATYEKDLEYKTILMRILKWNNFKEKNKQVELTFQEKDELLKHLGKRQMEELLNNINSELSGNNTPTGKIEVLKMPKHNYVFINEREAVPVKNKKP